jgi:RINT-1 / TIP-1 family
LQGAQQFELDIAVVQHAFSGYTRKPAAHFRELADAVKLLSLERDDSNNLMDWLRQDLTVQQVKDKFKQLGVFRLGKDQAICVLQQRL